MDAVGYLRVSTGRQGTHGMSLEAQQHAIETAVDAKGWRMDRWYREARSTRLDRPELERAMVRAREVQGALVVARFDRAWRSPPAFYDALDRARRERWAVVLLDPPVDLSTPFGEAMAGMAAVFAKLERSLISQRTREAIAARKDAGTYRGGALLPQAQPVGEYATSRILALHERGLSTHQIAERLTLEGVPTARQGRRWWHTTVAGVLRRAQS